MLQRGSFIWAAQWASAAHPEPSERLPNCSRRPLATRLLRRRKGSRARRTSARTRRLGANPHTHEPPEASGPQRERRLCRRHLAEPRSLPCPQRPWATGSQARPPAAVPLGPSRGAGGRPGSRRGGAGAAPPCSPTRRPPRVPLQHPVPGRQSRGTRSRQRGGGCLTPSSCSGGGRRSPQLPGLRPEPQGRQAPGGARSGRRPRLRAAGNAACGARRSPDRPRARRASEQHREPPPPPPPPRPRRSTAGRRDPRPKQGGRRTPVASSPTMPTGSRSQPAQVSQAKRLPALPRSRCPDAAGRPTQPPPTHPSEKECALPLLLRLMVVPGLQFGGGGRRERCLSPE